MKRSEIYSLDSEDIKKKNSNYQGASEEEEVF
jgi:hypothetical protein